MLFYVAKIFFFVPPLSCIFQLFFLFCVLGELDFFSSFSPLVSLSSAFRTQTNAQRQNIYVCIKREELRERERERERG